VLTIPVLTILVLTIPVLPSPVVMSPVNTTLAITGLAGTRRMATASPAMAVPGTGTVGTAILAAVLRATRPPIMRPDMSRRRVPRAPRTGTMTAATSLMRPVSVPPWPTTRDTASSALCRPMFAPSLTHLTPAIWTTPGIGHPPILLPGPDIRRAGTAVGKHSNRS